MPKETNISVRLSHELKDEVARIAEETFYTTPAFVLGSLKSIVEFYKENGYIALPLQVIPKQEYERLKALEEDATPVVKKKATSRKRSNSSR